MIIYSMLTGYIPQPDLSKDEITHKRQEFEDCNQLLNGTYREVLNDDCRFFVEQCLQRQSECRYSADSLLGMQWVKRLQMQREEDVEVQGKVKKNLAKKIKKNFTALKYANCNEWSLLRALISYGCLDEELN